MTLGEENDYLVAKYLEGMKRVEYILREDCIVFEPPLPKNYSTAYQTRDELIEGIKKDFDQLKNLTLVWL